MSSTGYTRQAAANIMPNLDINAEDLNAEYDQLQSAFDNSSGHDHSGSASGTGQPISLSAGVGGILPTANGGTGSSSTTYCNLATNVTGTLPVTHGGTGDTTLVANELLLGNGTSAVAQVGSLGTTTTVLHGNAAGAPTFGAVVLSTDVSGTLPIANGGTGTTDGTTVITNVSTMTALRALSPGVTSLVLLKGYYAIGDMPVVSYYWSSASTATDDGGQYIIPNAGGTGRWILIPPTGPVDVRIWGAHGDGTTADRVNIQNAFNSSYTDFYLAPTANGYRIDDDTTTHLGVNLPLNKTLRGAFTYTVDVSALSSKLVGDLDVTPVLYAGVSLNIARANTTAGSLTFSSVPGSVVHGCPVFNATNVSTIPIGAYVTSFTGTTVTLNKSPSGVQAGDLIVFGGIATQYQSCNISGIEVTRAAGSIPSNSIAIMSNQATGVNVDTVAGERSAFGHYLLQTFTDTGSYGANYIGDKVFTDQITDKHFVLDGWDNAYLSGWIFGIGNTTFSSTANAFFGITGGNAASAGGGPNALRANNGLANVVGHTTSNPAVHNFLQFYAIGAGVGDGPAQLYDFYHNHISATKNLITTDSSVTAIAQVYFDYNDSELGAMSSWNIFSLNAATAEIDLVKLTNNRFEYASIDLEPSSGIQNTVIVNNDFASGGIFINDVTSSDFGNLIYGNTALAGLAVDGDGSLKWGGYSNGVNFPHFQVGLDGIIFQCGTITINSGTTGSAVFATPFPNNCNGVTLGVNTVASPVAAIQAHDVTTSGFNITSSFSGAQIVSYVAFGI